MTATREGMKMKQPPTRPHSQQEHRSSTARMFGGDRKTETAKSAKTKTRSRLKPQGIPRPQTAGPRTSSSPLASLLEPTLDLSARTRHDRDRFDYLRLMASVTGWE